MRISDGSSDVCSSDLGLARAEPAAGTGADGGVRVHAHAGAAVERGRGLGCGRARRAGAVRARGAGTGRLPAAHAGAIGGRGQSAYVVTGMARRGAGRLPTVAGKRGPGEGGCRSDEHTSELQSLMRISYAVFCLKKK